MESDMTNSFLAKEPVGRLMTRYAVPCTISLLVAALYNIVDQIFIANASYLGSSGNAANNVVFPLTVVALAAAVMIGDGCCADVSIRLGTGDTAQARHCIGNAIVLALVTGICFFIAYLLFAEPLLTFFGASVSPAVYHFAREYFFWIALGMPFYIFGQAMNPIIRSDGSPRIAMTATLIGAILNLILDPIFIFGFHWGMAGAAAATSLGQIVTALISAYYLADMKMGRLHREHFRLDWQLIRHFLPLGICSFLSQISLVISMAAVNNMIRICGAADAVFSQAQYAQIPMAVIGIVMKFFQIVIAVVIGLAAGCIPIVGYNIGAGRRDRAVQLFTLLLKAETAVGLIALLIAEVFPASLIGLFGAAGESAYYTQFAIRAFRIYLCLVVLACINKAAFIYLQALGKPWISTFLSMFREIVLGVGLVLILPRTYGLDGVLYSMPAADLLTFAASAVVIILTYRELNEPAASDSVSAGQPAK